MQKQTILIVEDDIALLKMYSFIIESGGYRLLSAANAASALDILKHEIPQLIIEDLSLPDMNGLQLIHCIRQLPRCNDIPAIILSGSPGRIEAARLSSEQFVAFLNKPITAKNLLEVINQYLPAHS